MSDSLRQRRIDAAQASGGGSESPIGRHAVERLEREPGGGTVLDFGAGSGAFARRLVAGGFFERVVAADLVDFSEEGVSEGIEWLRCDLNEPLPLTDGEVDAILAVEVIEHLENPRFVAREWFRLLKPGGVLVGTTPNNESLRSLVSLLMRGHFAAFTERGYPAHISALVRIDISRILGEAGFESPEFFYSDEGCVPKVTRLSWQALSRGHLRGLRFSDNLGWTARRP